MDVVTLLSLFQASCGCCYIVVFVTGYLWMLLHCCHCYRLPVDVVVGAVTDRHCRLHVVEHHGSVRARWPRCHDPAHSCQRCHGNHPEEAAGDLILANTINITAFI